MEVAAVTVLWFQIHAGQMPACETVGDHIGIAAPAVNNGMWLPGDGPAGLSRALIAAFLYMVVTWSSVRPLMPAWIAQPRTSQYLLGKELVK